MSNKIRERMIYIIILKILFLFLSGSSLAGMLLIFYTLTFLNMSIGIFTAFISV